jgi:hypothetical protein
MVTQAAFVAFFGADNVFWIWCFSLRPTGASFASFRDSR